MLEAWLYPPVHRDSGQLCWYRVVLGALYIDNRWEDVEPAIVLARGEGHAQMLWQKALLREWKDFSNNPHYRKDFMETFALHTELDEWGGHAWCAREVDITTGQHHFRCRYCSLTRTAFKKTEEPCHVHTPKIRKTDDEGHGRSWTGT